MATSFREASSEKASDEQGYDYLLLSDVHLGSDIVPHVRPWAATSWLLQEAEIDARLIALLDHYRVVKNGERRFKLILAGDFLDLVGVSLSASGEHVITPPTPEEQRHGLGSAPDHVVKKIEAIAARHENVFRALARFLAAGHSLVLIRGNHDIELHWRAAQRAFIRAVVQHAAEEERAGIAARMRICPWFFAVDGLLYVEHGHEFDPMCSYGDPLLPTCPRDPRRIRYTPFSVLLRFIARPTRGLSSAAYDYVGMGAYAVLLGRLGLRGSLGIAVRYARASHRLVGECFVRAVDGGRRRMRRAHAQLARFARQTGVARERLEALRALYVKPAVESLNFIARSLYLDRILSFLVACALATVALFALAYAGYTTAWAAGIPAILLIAYTLVGRGTNQGPQKAMVRGAEHIASLFRARWVFMGHTHRPVLAKVAAEASYVNLGSWGQDDPPDERVPQHQSPCTYFVIRHSEGDYVGEFLRWDTQRGPLPALEAEHAQKAPDRKPSAPIEAHG